jgi:translocator assembly and maintenance protein 41
VTPELKYGVVEVAELRRDLEAWTTLYVAGRLHKPVVWARTDAALAGAVARNLRAALGAALLALPPGRSFDERALFAAVAGLSYAGDVRFLLRAEDPRKVANLVAGSLGRFRTLYAPHVRAAVAAGALARADGGWTVRDAAWCVQAVPAPLRGAARAGQLPAALRRVVRASSAAQTLKGALTAGPARALAYAVRKLRRGSA